MLEVAGSKWILCQMLLDPCRFDAACGRIHVDLLLYVAGSMWICCCMLPDPGGFVAGCCWIHVDFLLDVAERCLCQSCVMTVRHGEADGGEAKQTGAGAQHEGELDTV